MSTTLKLVVKSHVARDLLQSAGLFKTDKLVVWEYVPTVCNMSVQEQTPS